MKNEELMKEIGEKIKKESKREGQVKVLMKRHCPITKRGRWMEVWIDKKRLA